MTFEAAEIGERIVAMPRFEAGDAMEGVKCGSGIHSATSLAMVL